jgi:signal transduction histidine kinase
MSIFKTKKLALITIVYWFLLVYVIAALVFWFISLQQQNEALTYLRLSELNVAEPGYKAKAESILNANRRKTTQYIGEGATFLSLILVAAVFVYRATRRQFRLSLQQQNFMMAVTHELKTPIAVTRLNLETLLKRKLEEQQQQKLLNNTLSEVDRLNSLCNNILLASQLDAGSYQISKNEVNVSGLAARVVKDFEKRYPNRVFRSEIAEEAFINGEELLLELLLSNLIENALKYSSKESPVAVVVKNNASELIISISDEGPGIPADETTRIFEKFYRVGNEATRSTQGTGLGLYLCKKIAEDHNAVITVNNSTKGAVFTVTFNL